MQVRHQARAKRAKKTTNRLSACGLATALACAIAFAQQPQPEPVGTIRAARVTVDGQLLEAAAGPATSRLESGSEVSLGAGYALVQLVTGGEIHACGPANFRVLKSAEAVTVAVNSGRLRAVLDGSTSVTFYTPFITAEPIAIDGDPREVIVGLEAGGAMCVQAARGALRMENQFTGETLVVPQAGEFFLRDGQLLAARQSSPACTCEPPPQAPRPQLARSILAENVPAGAELENSPSNVMRIQPARPLLPSHAADLSQRVSEPPPDPPRAEPVWTVVMPPLRFDATEPEPPPETEPQLAILIREVRVQPALIFRGQVDVRPAPRSRGPSRGENPVGKFFRWLFGVS